MMFSSGSYILVLALAVLGASGTLITTGYGANGFNGAYGGTVCDTCHCVRTVVKPRVAALGAVQSYIAPRIASVVEQIPYSVSRRVDAPVCASTVGVVPTTGLYRNGFYAGNTVGVLGGAGYNNCGMINGRMGGVY